MKKIPDVLTACGMYGAGQHNWPHWHSAGKFIAFKLSLSYGHHFCRDCSLICYLPKVLKVKLFTNDRGKKNARHAGRHRNGNFVMDGCPKLTPFSYKQKGPFLQLSARVKFSDCLLDWRKLEKTCKILLHAVGNFSFCIQPTHSNPSPTERDSNFRKNSKNRF